MLEAGQATERFWLKATKHRLALHPWTILHFLIIRNKKFCCEDLNEMERSELEKLDNQLHSFFGMPKKKNLLLSNADCSYPRIF